MVTQQFLQRLLFVLALASLHAAYAAHPLDGLIEAEYTSIAEILKAENKIDGESRLALVNLLEPDKHTVLNWQAGDKTARQALVVVRKNKQVFEAVVDIQKRRLVSWTHIKNAQPALLDEEWMLSQVIVRSDANWVEAIKKRGIDNPKQVFCFPSFGGYFDTTRDKENRRLGMVACYDTGSENGLWGRPISGLLAIVDYDEAKVIELQDTGVLPIPEGGPAISPNLPNQLPASGPAEHRYRVNDNWIDWENWRFHLRIDPRTGPVLSQVSFKDKGRRRSVLYQASVSELFVPYMDPTQLWYFRTYLDVGEYSIGTSGVPLKIGIDCPANSASIDATFMNERGKIYTKSGIACVFERYTGDVAWTHYEIANGGSTNRRHTELVVRFIVWLGNYDYVIDWIFTETGAIKGRVGATGIVQIRGVESLNMDAKTAAADTAFGRLISPRTIGVNHDHFFNFRLDLDVDGTNNQFTVDRLRRVELEPENYGTPRKQIWQIFPDGLTQESQAKLNVDPTKPTLWRITNPAITNHVGNPVSYQLSANSSGRTLLDENEIAHRRAAFTDYSLWVTPYAVNERFAAGDYPNQHPGGAGLPAWTAADRSIENSDLVLWYTMAMHHVVRAEDWPIMPTVYKEFELRPFDFFDYNLSVSAPSIAPEDSE